MNEPSVAPTENGHGEITFHPMSYCDASGSRLLDVGGRIHRAIPEPAASGYRRLIDDGTIAALVEQGLLVESRVSSLNLVGWPLVVEHRTIPVVSYPCEWCPAMLRDAGRLVADLATAVSERGLVFSDASGWNVLFEGCRPVFVDLTSIELEPWSGWERQLEHGFRSYFLEPLALMARGYGDLARYLLADYDQDIARQFAHLMGLPSADLVPVSSGEPPRAPGQALRRPAGAYRAIGRRITARRHPTGPVRRLVRELDRISLPDAPIAPNVSLRPERDRRVLELVERLAPGSVTDLGAGDGYLSCQIARAGTPVVAIDTDERCVSGVHRRAVVESLPVLPLVLNLRNPTPGTGVLNRVVSPAFARLGGDAALALGIVDELVVDQLVPLERVVETVRRFSNRWVIVDAPLRPDVDSVGAYSVERVRSAFGEAFAHVETITHAGLDGALMLCEGAR